MIALYINDKLVDTSESVGLYINKVFNNLQNPTDYYSDYSKTISLPMTANNNLIFSNYYRQDSVVTASKSLDPRNKLPFKLLYNSKLLMTGHCRIVNANTIYNDKKYKVELFSSFGLVMNELKQLTFNMNEDKDSKYKISSPFNDDTRVDCNLVKESWEQERHNRNGNDVLDYVKFVPSYQGKYDDFESDKFQLLPNQSSDLTRERDEHYTREFRSYYQQPSLWVDKLWMLLKDKTKELTDFDLVLDKSWFNDNNPYWTDLIYTCPSLFNADSNFTEKSDYFKEDYKHYLCNIPTMNNLSSHHKKKLYFDTTTSNIYNSRTGNFNEDRVGYTEFNSDSRVLLLGHFPTSSNYDYYGRIRNDNPLFVKFSVINAETNQPISGASYTYMLYSSSTNYTNRSAYNEKIDVGTTTRKKPNVTDKFPDGYSKTDGYWFEAKLKLRFTIKENVPYYITMDSWFANNSKGLEYTRGIIRPHWDWVWNDFFFTSTDGSSGYTIFEHQRSASVKTIDYLRTNSRVSMYRVFPKDTTLLSVLLNYTKMFGLLWDVDEDNKKISVMTRNKFFSKSRIIDWSKKLDRSRDFILEPLCFNKRYVEFNVEDGKGMRYENYKSKYNVGYGSKKIDTEYQFNSDVDKLFEGIQPSIISQKSQFSRMENTEYPDRDNFMGYNHKIYTTEHYIENDNEGSNAGNSGAFYFCNGFLKPDVRLGFVRNGEGCVLISDDTDYMVNNDTYMWNLTGGNCVITDKIPDISTISRDGKFSVHFESPKEYYFNVDTSDTGYIYDTFWRTFIDERYSVQNKKLTGYFYLTPDEFSEIKFKDFVTIDNVLYHINKVIDFDFDTNSPVKVELCQVWNKDAYLDGQYKFPVLDAEPKTNTLQYRTETSVDVYSSSEWRIEGQPSWVNAYKDGDTLVLSAKSNCSLSRLGRVKLVNEENLICNVVVVQRSVSEITIDRNNITSEFRGGSFRLNISSTPSTISVVSKPDWCDVQLRSVDFSESKFNNNAVVVVKRNSSSISRSGYITFSNGISTSNIYISQLGGKLIREDENNDIVVVPVGSQSNYTIVSDKEIDINASSITRGTITPSNARVGSITTYFTPTLNTDVEDNTPETCSGGQLVLRRLDGGNIVKNYNVGASLVNYDVCIQVGDNGHFKVGTTEYTGTYFQSHPSGSTLSISPVADDGYVFEKWSDGNRTANRTLTITSDVSIYPKFVEGVVPPEPPTEDYYEFDNGENIEFDNNEKITY